MRALLNHRRLFIKTASVALVLFILAMPATQNAVAWALDEFVEATDRALNFPCPLLDHGKCFTLDRCDPTCPHCL